MSLFARVAGLVVAGLVLIALYVSVGVLGALSGAVANPGPSASPLGGVAVYLGLALTVLCGGLVLLLASSDGTR